MARFGFLVFVLICASHAACGDPDDPDARTDIEGRLIDETLGAPVNGRVTGFPDLGTVNTSSPAGTFRLRDAVYGTRYRLVAEAQGFADAELFVIPRFGESDQPVELTMSPAFACASGERRCALGGIEGVEVCRADRLGFDTTLCDPGQICSEGPFECVAAPTVTVNVMGSGSVISNPSGLACRPTCERRYPSGTEVLLEARSFGDSVFVGWGGACSGSEPRCALTVDADREVSASFETNAFRLSVETRGGAGSVQSTPAGIVCGELCQAFFDPGTQVNLTALPGADRVFLRWEQDCSGTDPVCNLDMSEAREARARFQRPGPVLDVTREGPGVGTVRSEPEGIDCGVDCAAGFAAGQEVVLTAEPSRGSTFAGWGGACSSAGSDSSCTLEMTEARSVSAAFDGETVEVRVTRAGGGLGAVASEPPGIDCGTDCTARLGRSQLVRLTATADPGSVFSGWSGACESAGSASLCSITPEADVTVEARFEPFFLAPLPVDPSCRFALRFGAPTPLNPACGGPTPAAAVGWTSAPSRTSAMGDGLATPGTPSALDLGVPGPSSAPATVELSVRSEGGAATLFSDGVASGPRRAGWSIRILEDGRLGAATFDGRGGASSATTAAGAISPGTWGHVAVVAEPESLTIFVDGAEAARTSGATRLTASSSTAWVGATRGLGGNVTDGLQGVVDELRISDGARYP